MRDQTIRFNNTQKEKSREVLSESDKYVCEQCQKTFSSKRNLSTHKQAIHEGVRYACDQCEYQATQQSSLTVHIKSKHEGAKHACDLCDYQATQQGNLRIHKECTCVKLFELVSKREIFHRREGGQK